MPLLRWQVRANKVRGSYKLLSGYLYTLASLRIPTRVMWRTSLTPSAFKSRDLRRAYSPITSLLAGNDMKMEVWRLLSTVDAVVLKREYSERLIGLYKCFCDPLS